MRALGPMTSVFTRERRGEDTGTGHVTAEAEVGVTGHKPRDTWSHQEPEEAGRLLPSDLSRRNPAHTLILNFWLPGLKERGRFCCFKPFPICAPALRPPPGACQVALGNLPGLEVPGLPSSWGREGAEAFEGASQGAAHSREPCGRAQ